MAFNPAELIEQKQREAGFDPKGLLSNTEAIQETLGADFDPENTAGTMLRLSISRGDNLEEKRRRVQKVHPKGDIKVMPKSLGLGISEDILVFRESPGAQWKRVEPEGFDVTDIGEAIAPSAEALAAETAVAIGTGGGSIPATIGRHALGAIAGETIEQAGQSLTGTQAQTPGEILLEPTMEGAFSAAGGFAASPFVAAKNIATGRGALRVGEEGLETLQAAGRLDPALSRGMTPALVSDNPALRLSERQSAALLPGLQRRYRQLTDMLDRSVRGLVDNEALSNTTTNVKDGLDQFNRMFLRRVGNPNQPMSAGGRALQAGVREYDESARTGVNLLFESARRIEEPQFNFQTLTSTASDLRSGVRGSLDPRIDKLITELENVKGPIQLSDGSMLSVTDQVRNVNTQLFALKNVKPGDVADQTTGQATMLLKASKQMLENPTNTNAAFREAWQTASQAAAERFKVLEKAPIIAAAKSQNPADLVKTYASPGQVDNLLALRDAISPERWNEFTTSFYSDLVSDPAKLSSKFHRFDKETLDVLMPRAEQEVWKKIAAETDRIASVGVDEIAEKQITNRNFIDTLIRQADPRKTSTIMRAANETNNKAMRDSLRASLLDWTWEGVVTQGKNTLRVNRDLLQSRVTDLQRSGIWRFLSKEERRILADAEVVSRAFQSVIDAGTSIQAAEAVSGIKTLERGAIRTFISNGLVARFYLSDMGRRVLLGSGLPNSNGKFIRLLGSTLAQTTTPEDISKLEEGTSRQRLRDQGMFQ